MAPLIGIVGDYDPSNEAHRATDAALSHVADPLDVEWVGTDEIPERAEERLGGYAGLLIAPASPYRSMEGALGAIRLARERGVPLVGT
ncbi:MAG: hypothetical protein E6G67_04525 [Actinobacteria bacterium]|nr:MAG: hypothetical protein E6G67_04525 [Actinomycetota bacterium]